MRGLVRECLRIEIPKVVSQSQVIEQPSGLAFDVFGKAEWIAAFRYPDGTNLSRPVIDVLKQMVMDSFVVFKVHRSAR